MPVIRLTREQLDRSDTLTCCAFCGRHAFSIEELPFDRRAEFEGNPIVGIILTVSHLDVIWRIVQRREDRFVVRLPVCDAHRGSRRKRIRWFVGAGLCVSAAAILLCVLLPDLERRIGRQWVGLGVAIGVCAFACFLLFAAPPALNAVETPDGVYLDGVCQAFVDACVDRFSCEAPTDSS